MTVFEAFKDKDLINQLEFHNNRISQQDTLYSNKLTELTAFMLTSPMPAWIKDIDGRMLFCNYTYKKDYGISPESYNAQFDEKFWSKREANCFNENDQKVVSGRKAEKFIERIYNQKIETHQDLEVWKWPITVGGKLIGVAGQVINARDIHLQGVKR